MLSDMTTNKPKYVKNRCNVPRTQEKPPKRSENHPGTQTRMHSVHSLQPMLQLVWQGFVEVPESPQTRMVVVPLHCGVEVNNDVRTWIKLMVELL